MVIGIIGGGASGMAAAIAASKHKDVQVIVFERQARVGRKLQATGNGRCNLSNRNLNQTCYHGDHLDFVVPALSRFDVSWTLNWFGSLGLYTVTEESRRVYPYSDQANSVVDVLRFALNRENIQLRTGFEVEKIRKSADGFLVEGNGETIACQKLIVACGGLAGTKLGGSMSGYKLLRSLGHRVTRLRPTLVQIKSDWSALPALKGVRAHCHAQIFCNGVLHRASTGELQFTEYGISGPVVFEISRDVCQEKGTWLCRLDFAPELSREVLLDSLRQRQNMNITGEDLLTGILHNRLGRVLVQNAGIRLTTPVCQLGEEALSAVCDLVKCLEILLTEPMGMDSAQVTAGGIVTSEFDPETMESCLVPGLFACGEVLDVDGDCGGYNLQWAWSSGYLAGTSAGEENR